MNPHSQEWFKSSFSAQTASCVQVRFADGVAQVRNNREVDGPVLVFDRGEWEAFMLGVFSGEFDMPL